MTRKQLLALNEVGDVLESARWLNEALHMAASRLEDIHRDALQEVSIVVEEKLKLAASRLENVIDELRTAGGPNT